MTEFVAICLAFAASFCTNYSTYMQKTAVDVLPRLKLRLTWTIIRSFTTNRLWLSAMLMDGVGTGLYLVALIWLPVSIVEPIITAGIGLLAYLAIKDLGEKPTRVDYLGMGTTVLGVVLLAVSLAGGLPEQKTYHPLELLVVSTAVFAAAILLPLLVQATRKGSIAPALGLSGGLFIGLAAVFSRLLMGDFNGLWPVWLTVCILLYPLGFAVFQAGLQRGRAVIVAPLYNSLVLVVPVVVGVIALNERLPQSSLLAALRLTAFILIGIGAVVLSLKTPV